MPPLTQRRLATDGNYFLLNDNEIDVSGTVEPSGGAIVRTGTGDAHINPGGVGKRMSTFAWVAVHIGLVGMVWFAGVTHGYHSRCREEDTASIGDGVVWIPLDKSYFSRRDFDHAGFGPEHGHDGMDGAATLPVTADIVNLGNGTDAVFLNGSGNTIYVGYSTDMIHAANTGDNTFVLNAAGGASRREEQQFYRRRGTVTGTGAPPL
jgi:hypothetical protein